MEGEARGGSGGVSFLSSVPAQTARSKVWNRHRTAKLEGPPRGGEAWLHLRRMQFTVTCDHYGPLLLQ